MAVETTEEKYPITEPGGFIDKEWEAEHAAELAVTHEAIQEPKPTIPEPQKTYPQGSTMHDLGFRTEKEYLEAQRYSDYPFGVHEGSMIPEGTVIVLDEKGEPYQRFKADQIPQSLSPLAERGQYKIPIKTFAGTEKLLAPKEYDTLFEDLSKASPEQQFTIQQKAGLIELGSVFVGVNEKGELTSLSASQVAEIKEKTPELYKVLTNQGYDAYTKAADEHNKSVIETQDKQEVETEPRAEVLPDKRWMNVRTGELFTDAERQALIQVRPAAQDELVRTPESIQRAIYSNPIVQSIVGLPEKVMTGALTETGSPLSSLITNPTQKASLDYFEGTANLAKGASVAFVAGVLSIPGLAIGAVVNPIETTKQLFGAIVKSAMGTGAGLYIIATSKKTPEAYRTTSTLLGVNMAFTIMAAIGVKVGVSGLAKVTSKGIKTIKGSNPDIVKAWRGVAEEKLVSTLKDAGASAKLAKRLDKATDKIANAIEAKNPKAIQNATRSFDNILKKDTTLDPSVKNMVQEGGKYIEANAEQLAKTTEVMDILAPKTSEMFDTSIGIKTALSRPTLELWKEGSNWGKAFRVTIDEIKTQVAQIQAKRTWGDIQDGLTQIRGDINRTINNNPTLSDSLTRTEWFKITPEKQPFREISRQPSWKASAEEAIVINRLQKLLDKMPQLRRDALLKGLQRSGEARARALQEMWDYLEEVYGKKALEIYMETEKWEETPPEGLESSVKGVEDAAKITEEIKKINKADKELREALEEVDRILQENKDKPPDTIIAPREPSPREPEGKGKARVAVKEKEKVETRLKTETKPKTTEEIERMMEEKKKVVAPQIKPSPKKSVFPGVKTKPIVAPAPLEAPLADVIGQTLKGLGLTLMRPSPIVTPTPTSTPTPTPSSIPRLTPVPTPKPTPKPSKAPSLKPSPAPTVVISPSSLPGPMPAPAPAPSPKPSPVPIPKPISKPKSLPKPPPRIIKKDKEKEKKAKIMVRNVPIAWRQGVNWYTIYPPYRSQSDIRLTREPPKGATVVTGRGSAYQTIQTLGGNANIILDLDLGIQDIKIKGVGRKPTIKFSRDIKQKTHGDISLKGIKIS